MITRASLMIATLVGALASVAAAEPRHVMVLHTEGGGDAGARGKIDSELMKLAKNISGTVEAGDISYADATVAAGCASPTDVSCKDELLSTMGLDELVTATVSATPGGELKLTVRRLAKGQPVREASTMLAAGQPPAAKMSADLGPMFGIASSASPPAKSEPAPHAAQPPAPTPAPAPISSAPPPQVAQSSAPEAVTAAPNNEVPPLTDGETAHRRLELTGLAGGGGLVLLGVIFWAEASSTQSDINAAPTKTTQDFQHLQDLENRGDVYSAVGNVMFIGGVAIAAVSGYFYWHDRRAHQAQHAQIAPTMFDHGAGLTLSFGGAP